MTYDRSNPYEIEYDEDRDARLTELHAEHVRGKVCPECGGELELSWTANAVEVNCPECGWGEEVA